MTLAYYENEIASLHAKLTLECRPHKRRQLSEQIMLAEREAKRLREHAARRGGQKNEE